MKQIITLCGSMEFFHELIQLSKELEKIGYSVLLPSGEDHGTTFAKDDDLIAYKRYFVDRHLEKIKKADFILIANYEKRGIVGYIGSNTLMEIAFAYGFHKPIILLYPVGEQPCKSEVLGIQSANLEGNLKSLNQIRWDRIDKMDPSTQCDKSIQYSDVLSHH